MAMMPNMDPKQMERLMRQMGINSKQVPATRVVIELEGQKLIISQPQVTEITAQGQKSYQISGNVSTESVLSEEDVKMIMEQTGASHDVAVDALNKANGNIAEAILALGLQGATRR